MTHGIAPVSSLGSAAPPRESPSVRGTHRLHGSSLHLRRSLFHLHVPRPKLVAGLNLESPSSRRDVALDPEPLAAFDGVPAPDMPLFLVR